jgi:hypothetical protein
MSDDRPASPNLHLRTPRALQSAVREAARRELMSTSEYVRRALVAKLRTDGLDPAAFAQGAAPAHAA